MRQFSVSFRELIASLVRNQSLTRAMVKREVVGRYRGSAMGLAWSFFNPLLMLAVYTFVFSVVFKARWGLGVGESRFDFGIVLFVGMIVHGLFAECLNRAPYLILHSPNYVKKVVFPLEILPWVAMGSALFHAAVSTVVLMAACILLGRDLFWTALLFPAALLPVIFLSMGFSWFLAAIGVYMRDIGQITAIFTTVMMFVSPVFYPISQLPAEYQWLLRLNPLAVVIEDCRGVLLLGKVPDLARWAVTLFVATLAAWAGFFWFQKSRKGFADVV